MLSLREFILEYDHLNTRRLLGRPSPWSQDIVLQSYRFGNFRRELDRTNRLLTTFFGSSRLTGTLVGNLVSHRMVSQPSFTSAYGIFGSYSDFERVYNDAMKSGIPTRPSSFMSCRSADRFLDAIQDSWDNSLTLTNKIQQKPTLESVYRLFAPVLGKFTSWQLALDFLMLHLVGNPGEWAHIGPGSGTALLALGLKPDLRSILDLLLIINESPKQLDLRVDELEGALCEYSKYIRLCNTQFPGKFRNFTPSSEHLFPVPTDSVLKEFYASHI
jgi:hypothetical protein